MNWSFVFFLLRFVVGRTRCASEVLRLNLLDAELRHTLAHCFQNIFEKWRFVLDPSQRVDARYNKRSQIRAHQSAFFQPLDDGSDLMLVGPQGQNALIMSDVGGANAPTV